MGNIHFLVWAPYSTRAERLSQPLGASLQMLSYKTKIKYYAPIKYPFLYCKTLSLLASKIPHDAVIICQSPPIFCPLTGILYSLIKKSKNIRIVIDAQTATFERPWTFPILNALTRWTIRKAWAIIVTNSKLQKVINDNYGVLPIVLDDGPLLAPENASYRSLKKGTCNGSEQHHHHQHQQQYAQQCIRSMSRQLRFTHGSAGKNFAVAVISSFANDEPIQEIIEAARALADTTTFYITGDNSRISARKLLKWKRSANNIIFTGFLDRTEYINLLEKVDAVLVLTKRDYTMLSGAHEALALEKPLITSDWQPLRQYFVAGTAYVNNSVSEIVNAVKYVQVEKDRMKKEMQILKHQKLKEWEVKVSELKERLSSRRGRANTVA
jgi:glycosyltransferase involved in cell wall biosynthesis